MANSRRTAPSRVCVARCQRDGEPRAFGTRGSFPGRAEGRGLGTGCLDGADAIRILGFGGGSRRAQGVNCEGHCAGAGSDWRCLPAGGAIGA